MSETSSADIGVDAAQFSALGQRLAEDEANPDDIVEWETVKTEAQKRWLVQAT